MADQILDAIIQLESQIDQQLQTEQKRADDWLAGVRRELELEAERCRQERLERNRQLLETAKELAEQKIAVILAAETDYCRRLEGLSEQSLLEVLERQLIRILPRQTDDHQNGQN